MMKHWKVEGCDAKDSTDHRALLSVISTEVEKSLTVVCFTSLSKNNERCLDFARHDKIV